MISVISVISVIPVTSVVPMAGVPVGVVADVGLAHIEWTRPAIGPWVLSFAVVVHGVQSSFSAARSAGWSSRGVPVEFVTAGPVAFDDWRTSCPGRDWHVDLSACDGQPPVIVAVCGVS